MSFVLSVAITLLSFCFNNVKADYGEFFTMADGFGVLARTKDGLLVFGRRCGNANVVAICNSQGHLVNVCRCGFNQEGAFGVYSVNDPGLVKKILPVFSRRFTPWEGPDVCYRSEDDEITNDNVGVMEVDDNVFCFYKSGSVEIKGVMKEPISNVYDEQDERVREIQGEGSAEGRKPLELQADVFEEAWKCPKKEIVESQDAKVTGNEMAREVCNSRETEIKKLVSSDISCGLEVEKGKSFKQSETLKRLDSSMECVPNRAESKNFANSVAEECVSATRSEQKGEVEVLTGGQNGNGFRTFTVGLSSKLIPSGNVPVPVNSAVLSGEFHGDSSELNLGRSSGNKLERSDSASCCFSRDRSELGSMRQFPVSSFAKSLFKPRLGCGRSHCPNYRCCSGDVSEYRFSPSKDDKWNLPIVEANGKQYVLTSLRSVFRTRKAPENVLSDFWGSISSSICGSFFTMICRPDAISLKQWCVFPFGGKGYRSEH